MSFLSSYLAEHLILGAPRIDLDFALKFFETITNGVKAAFWSFQKLFELLLTAF